ncbi:MAG: Fe-S cluster assembly protein SufD [Acidimicrobiales bacterium]|nr:Fe-S cluster assembly protein SufD [Acidimicrobiales bacterium]
MPSFTPEAVRSLHAADTDLRLAALQRFTSAPMPSPEEELWRYSRIAELSLDRFSPGSLTTTVTGAEAVLGSDVLDDETELDLFGDLNRAFMSAIVLRVPRGKVLDAPVVITHTLAVDAVACFPRLVIDAGEDSEITVIERFVSDESVSGLIAPVLRVRAAQAARVTYLSVNELGSRVWQIANQQAEGMRDSTTLLSTVALGGDYARVRTHARLTGQGGSTRQVALYFADGTQTHDFRTTQEHIAPKTSSDLLFKGAVNDSSRSVYTGLIKIGPEARGTVAFQTNRNLTLSDGAWAESVPNLEIETNDVKCSHASTVGPIDEEQRFYLESRGIQPDIAERLVVLGFFDEVLAQLPVGGLADELRERISAKLHTAVVPEKVTA